MKKIITLIVATILTSLTMAVPTNDIGTENSYINESAEAYIMEADTVTIRNDGVDYDVDVETGVVTELPTESHKAAHLLFQIGTYVFEVNTANDVVSSRSLKSENKNAWTYCPVTGAELISRYYGICPQHPFPYDCRCVWFSDTVLVDYTRNAVFSLEEDGLLHYQESLR